MPQTKPSFAASTRWKIGFHVVLTTACVLALLVGLNYLAAGYYQRLPWAADSRLHISPQTLRVLQSLTNTIETTIVFNPREDEDLHGWVVSLLKEYHFACPRLRVKILDYTRFPADAETLLARHKLTTLKDKDFVLFECDGRTKVVYSSELPEYDLTPLLTGQSQELRRKGFKGEMLFTAAIHNVADARKLKAYFLTGHGEHDPDNKTADHGYGRFAAILREENNIEWSTLSLLGTNDIPADCGLLIIAGPAKTALLETELEKIASYLKLGRRLFVLLNNTARGDTAGLDTVLAPWNIRLGQTPLEESKEYLASGPGDFITAKLNGEHPTLKALVKEGLQLRLVHPRMVSMLPAGTVARGLDAPKIEVLAATSDNASDGRRRGSFPIILAVEHGSIKNVVTERGATRIIVLGDSLCFDNQLLNSLGNHYFAGFAINWLLERPQILLEGLGPRPVQEYKVVLTQSELRQVQWLLLAGLPGGLLLLGLLVGWWRRT